MADPTPDQIKLAREIAKRVNPALHAASSEAEELVLAAIIEVTERAAKLTDKYLEPVLSRALRNGGHLK